jgi:hypothetical protein
MRFWLRMVSTGLRSDNGDDDPDVVLEVTTVYRVSRMSVALYAR